ncbi:MAG TPA: uroporphyrinogen decarboxylase family protein [Anaerolineaceae bacterium]|nr:uroporphyrinogen decarboxylase family protein [Anaerolineaceae bacterium]
MNQPKLSHRQRLEHCLAGDRLDRPPVALWRHFPVDDQDPHRLAAAVTAFQGLFDFDFIKNTPASSYSVKDWGAQDQWEGNPEGTRRYLQPAFTTPDDWTRLPLNDPRQGALGESLVTLRLLVKAFSPETPIIQTIFNPLSQAKNLVGKEHLLAHLRQNPDALLAGLKAITENTLRYLEEAKKTGIDGIFFAVQHAQSGLLTVDEFETFCRPFDLRILDAARELWFNVLHLHGENVMFSAVRDYPVQVINWHDRQTEPSLRDALSASSAVLCGGLRQWEAMVLGSAEDVRHEAADAVEQTGGQRFILGTGCVLPITAPYGNIVAARQSVDTEVRA